MSQVPIPDDWDGTSWQCLTIEWPDSDDWTAIFVGVVTWVLKGRFWDGATGTITEAQDIAREIYERNFLEDTFVGCLEQLTLAINCLCQAMYATSGTGGSGGAGTFASEPSNFVDDGNNFPDGYADRTEYLDDKCNLSQFLIDRWIGDLQAIKTIDAAGQSAAVVATILGVLLLTPIAFVAIIAIAASILGLTALGISVLVTALSELISRLEAMDICELYEADSATEAIENVQSWIAAGTYSQQTLTTELGEYFITTDAVNILFDDKSDTVNYDQLPVGDCSSCEEPAQFVIVTEGEEVSREVNGNQITLVVNNGQGPAPAGSWWVTLGRSAAYSGAWDIVEVTETDTVMNSVDYTPCTGSTVTAPGGSNEDWMIGKGPMRACRWATAGFANDPGQLTIVLELEPCP